MSSAEKVVCDFFKAAIFLQDGTGKLWSGKNGSGECFPAHRLTNREGMLFSENRREPRRSRARIRERLP